MNFSQKLERKNKMNEENKIYKGKDVKYGLKKALKLGYKDGLKEGKLLQRQEDVKEFKEMIENMGWYVSPLCREKKLLDKKELLSKTSEEKQDEN
jgi:flagellar biosynthesis/type III secretory pathway protein FliH